jgi:mono/diheme cytochrome c family protein
MKVSLRNTSVLAVLVLALVAAACGGGGESGGDAAPVVAENAAVTEGHQLFKQTCAVCHGQNGEGMPALGKNLNANEFVSGNSDAELVAFMIEGRPATHPDNTRGVDMPPRGGNPNLTDEDLGKIAAYLKSLQ